MQQQITNICLALPYHLGNVNCYLIRNGEHFVLVDTGCRQARQALVQAIRQAGCEPESLKLILLTHGDFDHSGNAAYLRETFGAPVAMHLADRAMTERAEMFVNRHPPNLLIRKLTPLLFGFSKSERFQADLFVEEGASLGNFGLAGRVISIPGHSAGSIGILLDNGALFCGDLLENIKTPALGSIMDEPLLGNASRERLRGFNIQTIYPGHGKPFEFSALAI